MRRFRFDTLALRAVVGLLAVGLAAAAIGSNPAPLAAAAPPNIVMFYIDDVNPHDGRLWSDPERTPAIYNTFIAHGIHFTHAYGEDPLCCPARASLLTGLHTHNNGVDINDGRLFSPQETVAGRLKDAGYTTMWIGKYMNANNLLSKAGWSAHMAPWSVFDGIYGTNGKFYNYSVRTKDSGMVHYDDVHSTQMVMDRAVSRFAAAPASKPIFAVLSIYNTHRPNEPVPVAPELFAKCDDFASWWTPAYNEADVSDKPAYIRALPLLPNADGWPMGAYCREMFGIDLAVQRITDELAEEGRLNNTLLVFAGDNGMAWGAHRKGQEKAMPYATPVPLYMAWPAGWGTAPREIDDYVTNIDFAPTFCELGGCTLGPYPTGQIEPDGRSLVDLITHGTPLGRDALLESVLQGEAWRKVPGWSAVRTTPESPLGLWHYVEYVTGERELYDMTNDPYELDNLAGDGGHASIRAALAQRLRDLLGEGRVSRPDLSLWYDKAKSYAGYFRFASTATAEQTLNVTVRRGQSYKIRIPLRNNEVDSDSFRVTSSVTGGSRVTIKWLLNGVDVTAQMRSSGLPVSSLAGSSQIKFILQVVIKSTFRRTDQTNIDIDVESTSISTQDDHVVLVLRR